MLNFKTEIKWAFVSLGFVLVWMLLEKISGLHSTYLKYHPIVTMLYLIPAIWINVLAFKDIKARKYGGIMSFKQGFLSGFVITLIITVCSPAEQWVISYIITPDYFSNVIAYSLETGYHKTLEDARAQFNFKTYATQSTVWAFIFGTLISLVLALVFKTRVKSA